jgi:predicted HicB family RNase H-like nuclease
MRKAAEKPPKETRKAITIYLPLDVYDALVYQAAAADRSLSGHVLHIIRKEVKKTLIERK